MVYLASDMGPRFLEPSLERWLHSTHAVLQRAMTGAPSFSLGDAHFFKDDRYWVLKSGGMNQDAVEPKSIGVDWLRCPVPPSTSAPANPDGPGRCRCDLTDASWSLASNYLLVSLLLAMKEFVDKITS